MGDVVDTKIEDQAEFMRWWKDKVTGSRHNKTPSEPFLIGKMKCDSALGSKTFLIKPQFI
jgi:hypothetical protein